jgi:predicted esterase
VTLHPRGLRARRPLTVALLLWALAPSTALTQAPTAAPGTLMERVRARSDSTQSMAIYIPTAYTPERRWPVLFLMDPRGGAMNPMSKFRVAAERYGYIVISSYNTLSDGAREPNVRALDAMLAEAQDRFALDERRFYLAGFSGTARMSWEFAVELHGHVAGVIGVGAGFPSDSALPAVRRLGASPFAYFGTAGFTDYNYWEVRGLDDTLDAVALPHHFEFFDGVHQWPPEATATRAVEWMELQAMRAGLRPRDAGLIDSLYDLWHARAAAKEESDPLESWRAYVRLRDDFQGLRSTADAESKVASLGETKRAKQALEAHRRLASRDSAYVLRSVRYLRTVRSSQDPPTLSALRQALDLDALLRETRVERDPTRARAAQVMLERAFVYLSFYEPREYLESRQYARAIALLQGARHIKPDAAPVCLMLARAYAAAADPARAIESLDCVVRKGIMTASQLERDQMLAPLRRQPGFHSILERLRGAGRSE